MNWNWLKNLSPTHEPVLYSVAALVLYQVFVQHQPFDEKWLQYIIEIIVGGGARQIVKPLAKIKDSNASDNVGFNQREVDLQSDPESADGSGLRGQNRIGTVDPGGLGSLSQRGESGDRKESQF